MSDERRRKPFRAVDLLGDRRLNEPAVCCREINWQKCVICQDDKSGEKLRHSNNSNNCAVETGHVNIAIKLQGSHELGMCFRPMCRCGPCLAKMFHPQLCWNKMLLNSIGHVT